MDSFRSRYHHNKSMKGDPVGRIVVTGPRILYRNKEYSSASSALLDYISEFQGTPGKLKQSVPVRSSNDLLELLTTPSRIQNGDNGSLSDHYDVNKTSQISDTLKRELKLSDFDSSSNENSVQKTIEDSYRRMKQVDGAIQVADALNKSHDVLRKVDEDRLSDIGPSLDDIQSVATESLICVNPFIPVSHNVPNERPQGHIYSYRTPRPKTHTVSDLSLNGLKKDLLNTGTNKNHSVMDHKQLSRSLPKPNFSLRRYARQLHQTNQTTGEGHRYRSRSASPGFENNRSNYHRESFHPPHLVENMNASKSSKQSDSDMRDLKSKLGGRHTPSWIEDIVGSSAASSIVLSDQWDLFLHREDISSVSGHSDPTSLSTTVPSLRLTDLELLQESNGRTNNHRRRHGRGHIQTSTPLKKSLPAKFYSGKDDPCDFLPGHLTQDTDYGLTASKSRDNSQPIYKSNDSKINHMFRELDVIRQKLKSSNDDTHHCLRDLTPKLGATNLVSKFDVNGHLDNDQFHPIIDLEKPLSLMSDGNFPAVSSITKDLDQATRTLSLGDYAPHSICQSSVRDEVLEGDRDWEKTPLIRPQVGNDRNDKSWEKKTHGVIRDLMHDCLQNDRHQTEQKPICETLTGGPQPGSMEALKNMLFKLQWEASSVNNLASDLAEERQTLAHTQAQSIQVETVSSQSDGKPLEDYHFQTEPGGQCLERALVHLSRLQSLVQSDTFNPESRANSTIQASTCLHS